MAKKKSAKQKKISLIKGRRTRAINKIKKLDLSLLPDRKKAREISEQIMFYNNQLNEINGNTIIKRLNIDSNTTETELGHAWDVEKIIEYLQDLNIDKLNGINLTKYPHKLIDLVYKYIHSMTSKDVLKLHFDEDENTGFIAL